MQNIQDIDENILKNIIGKKIKEYRTKTQEASAEKAGISLDTWSKIENEKNIPSTITLINICNALEITPNNILSDFIKNKTALLQDDLKQECMDLSKDELQFIIDIIKFIKNHRREKTI